MHISLFYIEFILWEQKRYHFEGKTCLSLARALCPCRESIHPSKDPMNQQAICHSIQGCPSLFIDAFKAFKHKISFVNDAFILTHYHSDHYNGLPRGDGYLGPAKIHCTPITARLLERCHKIKSEFIIAHEYGQTWTHQGSEITFYDANHCPGAAIILVKNPQGIWHLHTGDMRFHLEKFSKYPLLSHVVLENKLDILYLDTTYSKPKHTFIPQDQAIECIASEVKQLLKNNDRSVQEKKQSFFLPVTQKDHHRPRTLVLLSCYSIGKEKVLWQSSLQSNQLIFVNKTKYQMLECIQDEVPHCGDSKELTVYDIIQKCTLDPALSDLHVIQMGTAGSLFPFFQPNFIECALYAHRMKKGYTKVVAFIPTGWADASQYNKDNASSRQNVDLREVLDGKKICGNEACIDVEVRLVPYSEHSSYDELRACVQYMKPKRIIPTVFSGEKDYETIEKRFRDLVDGKRAKKAFIDSICGDGGVATKKMKHSCSISTSSLYSREINLSVHPGTILTPSQKGEAYEMTVDDSKVALLVNMGFEAQHATRQLLLTNNNVDKAIERLLGDFK